MSEVFADQVRIDYIVRHHFWWLWIIFGYSFTALNNADVWDACLPELRVALRKVVKSHKPVFVAAFNSLENRKFHRLSSHRLDHRAFRYLFDVVLIEVLNLIKRKLHKVLDCIVDLDSVALEFWFDCLKADKASSIFATCPG